MKVVGREGREKGWTKKRAEEKMDIEPLQMGRETRVGGSREEWGKGMKKH